MDELLAAYPTNEETTTSKRKVRNLEELPPPKRRVLPIQEVNLVRSSYIPKKKRISNKNSDSQNKSDETKKFQLQENEDTNDLYYSSSIPHEIWKQINNPKSFQYQPAKNKFPKLRIHAHDHTGVTDLCWSPCNGKFLLSSGNDKNVKLWNIFEEQNFNSSIKGKIMKVHEKGIREIDWNLSGILSCSWDKSIALTDAISAASIREFQFQSYPTTIQWNSLDKNIFINGSSDSSIYCWDIRAPEFVVFFCII